MLMTITVAITLGLGLGLGLIHPDQIRTPGIVRVGAGDAAPGVLVNTSQIGPGRWVRATDKAVCVVTWVRVTGAVIISTGNAPSPVARQQACYTPEGMVTLFAQRPEWQSWYESELKRMELEPK